MLVATTITPTTPPTTPTTRPPLLRYNEKQAIDQVDLKLCEALTLVDSILSQTTKTASVDHHGSTRPTCVTTHERLKTDLTITATLEGRTVQTKAIPQIERYLAFPHGLHNSAALASHHAHLLFADSTPIDPIPGRRTSRTH